MSRSDKLSHAHALTRSDALTLSADFECKCSDAQKGDGDARGKHQDLGAPLPRDAPGLLSLS